MDNDEKKFKLNELPDEGSHFIEEVPPPKRKKKSPQEPRIVNIKKLSDIDKKDALSVIWRFDKPKLKWGWIVALLVLIVLQNYRYFLPVRIGERDEFAEFGSFLYDLINVMDYVFFLVILFPFIFKFEETEELFFEINFNGISAVENIRTHTAGAKRVFLRWDEILSVKKKSVGRREVLEIHSAKGPEAQLIWDIANVKKKVVKQILRGLINDKHPLRIFIEKEVT